MSRALTSMMVETTDRPFSRSVVPVSTMSTITSDRPSSGASSMEPCSVISSISRPSRWKCARAMRGYFVYP